MLSFDPKEVSTSKLHALMLGAVGPRPISFASTVDSEGRPNLSPFSFFNMFSANPPILIFSPARRVRNNTVKHTLLNAKATGEVVINIVNYGIVHQASLSSTEYGEGINEFEKAGLTMLKSDFVKPFRVAESPVQFECKVNEIMEMGTGGGAGNLIVCEVLKMHIKEDLLDKEGKIDQEKIDLVARMGGNWYTRAKMGLFEVPKPISTQGIGIDAIPEEIRKSAILTGNDLAILGNIEKLPTKKEIEVFIKEDPANISILETREIRKIHSRAKKYIVQNEPGKAWKLLLANITTWKYKEKLK